MLAGEEQGSAACAASVTALLKDAAAGDPRASEALLPLVYDQLRALAGHRMRQERPDQTLQATALVHEAYLRLVDTNKVQLWDSRWHFFAAAAEAMRRILVDQARQRGSIKRGGGAVRRRIDLEDAELTVNDPPEELLTVDEGLSALSLRHPEKAQLVKLRYFAGLTAEEAAAAMGISIATANRRWAYARAWLFRYLDSGKVAE